MKIHAHQLTYLAPNVDEKIHLSLMIMHVADEFNQAFEASIPNWPDSFVNEVLTTKYTQSFFNINDLAQKKIVIFLFYLLQKI